MIVITGGAGFIGSNLHAALVWQGEAPVVVDTLGHAGQWRNLARHPPAQLVHPEALDAFLAAAPPIDAIVHMGAISDTTATDGDLVWATNVELPWRLFQWCAAHGTRFIYASSAATYGDGAAGFDDDPGRLHLLRPLNLYGWTKHAFDLRVHAHAGPRPPQCVGLKFFNVYGPNEHHKGHMISVVKVKFDEVTAGQPARLFKSARPDVADGAQARDFIHVDDVVRVLLWLLSHPEVNGLYNLGSGTARTYLDLAHAVCDAAGRPRAVEFVPMPAALAGQYQSFTEARMDRLRAQGYDAPFLSLEDGIARYVALLAGPEHSV